MRFGAHASVLRLLEGHKGRARVARARREWREEVVEAFVAGLNAELTGGDVAQAAGLPKVGEFGRRAIADAPALVERTGLLWRHRSAASQND
jgi:hypothetical protein